MMRPRSLYRVQRREVVVGGLATPGVYEHRGRPPQANSPVRAMHLIEVLTRGGGHYEPPVNLDRLSRHAQQVPPKMPAAVQKPPPSFSQPGGAGGGPGNDFWQVLRQAGHDIACTRSAAYGPLPEQAERAVIARGRPRPWATDAAAACGIVLEIARRRGVRLAGQVQEHGHRGIGLNQPWRRGHPGAGEPILGEYIVQPRGWGRRTSWSRRSISPRRRSPTSSREAGVDAQPRPRI